MVVALRKNLVLTDSDDTFISDFSANFEEQYNYINEHYPDTSATLKLYDVLKAFASYVTLIATGLPTGASIEWFLPLTDITYYGWDYNNGAYLEPPYPSRYTTSATPAIGDSVYKLENNSFIKVGTVRSSNGNTSFHTDSIGTHSRNSSLDITVSRNSISDPSVDVIKGSLVPYVVTLADTSKYIDYYRANEDHIFDFTDVESNTVILTINPDPADAIVVLEVEGGNPFDFEQVGNTITVSPGTKVHYTVSKTDYITQSNTIIVNETQTVEINLSETLYTYIIHPTPADATVTLTASGYTQLDNSISVPRGTTVTWSVSANDYISESGTKVVNDNCADNISLKALVEFTVTPTPNDATVTLIATGYTQVGNSIKVPYGTTVVWMVEKTGYTTKSGSKIMTEDTEAQIILNEMLTLTIVPSPNDAIVHLTSPGYVQSGNSITVPYGTAVDWEVSKEGMGTKQGRKVVSETESMEVVLLRYITFTITPTPNTATVELTADGYEQEGNSIEILSGTRVHWKVYKAGYLPQSNYVVVNNDTTLPVTLEQAATLTINPTPADSIVTLTAEGYGQYGNKITVPLNTRVYWSVVKTGYVSQYGHEDMSADLTKNITLIQN